TLLKDTFSQHARFAREREPLNQMAYDQLESALMDGHPYHPCYKSRIGFSVSDHYRYGPEFEAEIRPQWVALCKELAGEHALPGRTYRDMMLTELGEEQLLGFDSILLDLGYKPSDYVYLPVHPW